MWFFRGLGRPVAACLVLVVVVGGGCEREKGQETPVVLCPDLILADGVGVDVKESFAEYTGDVFTYRLEDDLTSRSVLGEVEAAAAMSGYTATDRGTNWIGLERVSASHRGKSITQARVFFDRTNGTVGVGALVYFVGDGDTSRSLQRAASDTDTAIWPLWAEQGARFGEP